MPNRRLGDSLTSSNSRGPGPKNENDHQQQLQQQGANNGTLLPMIGILEKPPLHESSPPSSSGSVPVSGIGSNIVMMSPKSGKRRRNAYMRKATVEEIQFFTDLLKQSMVTESRVTVAYDDELVMQGELLRMSAAEAEQCEVDHFWGIEYEQACQVRVQCKAYSVRSKHNTFCRESHLPH